MAGDYDNSQPHEYCTVHDQPMDWCKSPDKCREIMTGRGLCQQPGEARPETMLQPVTFDDSPGEARTVRMIPADGSEDEW